jgi:hypothetical protein
MRRAELRRRINADRIGFDPDRMKTVHVANGLFTEILEMYYPTDLMNRLVVNERRQLPRDARRQAKWLLHSNEELLPLLKDAGKLPSATSIETLSRLRFHFHQHMDADNGVFDHDDGSGCAYSAATHLMVTSDRNNDGFSGNFLAYLLKHDFGVGSSPAVDKIAHALNENLDPMSVLAYIFTPEEEQPILATKRYADRDPEDFDKLIVSCPDLQVLRRCFDRLSTYYPERLSSQRFLRLLIILGSLVLIRYLVMLCNQNSQAQANDQPVNLAFLIDARQGRSLRIRQSSQNCYSRTTGALADLYAFWLKDWIVEQADYDRNGSDLDVAKVVQTYQRLINELPEIFPRGTPPPEAMLSAANPTEAAFVAGMHLASNMLTKESKDNFLSSFIRDLGVRSGLLKPRSTSQRHKHFDPQADTLEVLVMALLEPDTEADGVTLGDFADRLWKTFGMLFGGLDQGATDFRILANLGIQESNLDDLNENCDALVVRLVELGLAKEFADGLILIQCPQ